jgi:1-deoxy-D-xylulose-5-phosphate reductoisomerase
MKLTVLGATGSIGVSTLDVVAQHPERFEVVALTGHSRIDVLAEQCIRFRPRYAVTGDETGARQLRDLLATQNIPIDVMWGEQALIDVAQLTEVDAVMAAIVGAAGLPPALAAASAGKRVLLANKEALVMAGAVFMAEARLAGAVLLPIDSEHNAIFQAMPVPGTTVDRGVRRILLTASGGPFRTRSLDTLKTVSVEEAVAHPNWSMGRKISVDSATMMNKGLEVIEAHWLFNLSADQIDVVIHPQSVIHSMVEYLDGSVLAQLGNPDMRTPIAHALAWPERIDSGVASLDLCQIARLDFSAPDFVRFPCLALAYEALRSGGNRPAVLNAANEVAVEAFLDRRIAYLAIADVVRSTLNQVQDFAVPDLETVNAADSLARQAAGKAVALMELRAA